MSADTRVLRGSRQLAFPQTPILARLTEVLAQRGVEFRSDGVFIARATPINRAAIHDEAVA